MTRALVLLVLAALILPGCVSPGPGDGTGADVSPGSLPGATPGGGTGQDPVIEEPEDPPLGEWDLHVTVRAGEVRATIDRRFYGMNIADWSPHDYMPVPNANYSAYLRALEPGVLRWPAGHTSQEYQWERMPAREGGRVLTRQNVDAFLELCRLVGAEPLVAVNLKTGTPQMAADLVRYINVEKGYGVKWWQIGNEPDLGDGKTPGPDYYAHRYLEIEKAMRAVDPGIRIVGAELMTGAHVMATNGARDWLTPILQIAGKRMDAIGWHYYPLDSAQPSSGSSAYPTIERLFQEVAPDWRPAGLTFADEIFPHLKRVRDQYAPGAELWVTEIAEDSGRGGAQGIVDRHAGALWAADVLGRFAVHGPDAMVKFVFKSGRNHMYTLVNHTYQPRPEYYTYWLYARHFGSTVVTATSDGREWVNGHAALRDDGSLTVVLVNKRTDAASVRLTLEDFLPGSASHYVITGASYEARESLINGVTLTPDNVLPGPGMVQPVPTTAYRDQVVEVPPLSVTLITFQPR